MKIQNDNLYLETALYHDSNVFVSDRDNPGTYYLYSRLGRTKEGFLACVSLRTGDAAMAMTEAQAVSEQLPSFVKNGDVVTAPCLRAVQALVQAQARAASLQGELASSKINLREAVASFDEVMDFTRAIRRKVAPKLAVVK